jgi:glycerol-3-phosphate O-acyltransferase
MTASIEMPLWLVILVLGLAAIAALDRIIGPGLRWFLRRRMERAVEELNKRLERPIQPFKLMRRQDQVIRLVYDSHVMEAVEAYAREQGVPPNVAFAKAQSYAREIVPGFSTATYFGFAIRVARRLSRGFYNVRLGRSDAVALREIDPRASVVFVMNHRSNMDYVLVTWLAAGRSALSYAVGEWARVWPLKALLRAMGAFFIRRRYSNALYRAVLARYVQMSVHEGVTQAMFPEGGLSLTGAVGPAKMGLLTYIVRDFDPSRGRDVVFVPVALGYDRVLEDRVLIKAGQEGVRRFRARLSVAFSFVLRLIWQKARGRLQPFGYAAVCFGQPLSLRNWLVGQPGADVPELAELLMQRIRQAVPVLPVSLTAAAVLQCGGIGTRDEVQGAADEIVRQLLVLKANVHLPGGSVATTLDEGLSNLTLRGILAQAAGRIGPAPEQESALAYYAAATLQRLGEPADPTAPALPPGPLPPATET